MIIKTSVMLDADLWKDFKISCISRDIPVSKALQDAILEWLKENPALTYEEIIAIHGAPPEMP